MISPSTIKPNPLAAILVYGTPTSPELTQASWFRAEDKQAAKAAAVGLKFSVIELQTDTEKALTVGVHEGVLKGSGRMIVGSVTHEVYRKIEEFARKGTRAETASTPESAAASGVKASPEQNINTSAAGAVATSSAPASAASTSADAKPTTAPIPAASSTSKPEPPPAPPNPWEALRVGARVLAAYWNDKKEFEGFWLATVKRIDAGEFTLEWSEAPEYPPFKIPPKNVALVHPEFRPTGK
jgi:hypothetical protein